MTVIAVPKRFFDDHEDRDLPTPSVIRSTRRHYIINSTDPAIGELESDAEHYADGGIGDDPSLFGLISSARATLRAIRGE